jgi:hypothetical protein
MVVFIVWALAFSFETVDGATGVVRKMDLDVQAETPLVVKWSRAIMSEILQWNARSNGASAAVTEATRAFAEKPSEVLRGVKSTLELKEFKALVSNPSLQELARNRDFDALKKSPEYLALMNHSAVKRLQELVMPSGTEKAKEQVSNYLFSLWHDIDFVKSDPEFIRMIEDSEIQSFLKGNASDISLSLLTKGKNLLAFISRKKDSAVASLTGEANLPPLPVVYKWYDDRGVLNVTDLEHVPNDKLDVAELVLP